MIDIENLSFGYKVGQPVLAELTWTFPTGTMSAVTGRSGRGKSTLLYLVGLLLTPWSGRIHIAGIDVTSKSDHARSAVRAGTIGFVFQDAALDPTRSVLDNVIEGGLYAGVPTIEAVRRAEALLERFEVAIRKDHKPGEVSGGQAQRIALCRALLTRPRIVLADEPTGNLDFDTAQLVIDTLRGLAVDDEATVVIASHDPAVVAACDSVLSL